MDEEFSLDDATVIQTKTSREELLTSDAAEVWMEQLKLYVADLEVRVRDAIADRERVGKALVNIAQVVEVAGALEAYLRRMSG